MEQELTRQERRVRIIPATQPRTESGGRATDRKKRVAAYCRVSTESEEQLTSYTAQKAYYTQLISENPNWEMAGVFADKGLSGTSMKRRDNFNRMIAACKRGRIDLILTKSLSRFARNTVDCLETVRMLKANGIGVLFEKENINTLTESSEFLITLFSGFAQAESESISKNVSWGIQKSREAGKVPFQYERMLGYRKGADGKPEIVPGEAEVIKRIYRRYLDGCSLGEIQQELEADHVPTAIRVKRWSRQVIQNILKNERYIGDALLQKTYITDCISKRERKNLGERPMVYVENNHPAIIPKDIFYRVQEEMARRNSKRKVMQKSARTENGKYSAKYALSEILVCGECGTPYKRCTWARNGKKRIVWRCVSRLEYGRKYCHNSPTIDEDKLHSVILAAMNELAGAGREAAEAAMEICMESCTEESESGISIPDLREQLADVTTRQEELLELVLEDMDNPELNRQMKALTEEKLNLQAQVQAIQEEQKKRENQKSRLSELREFLQENPERFAEYDDCLVRKMIEKITITDAETIRIRFRNMDKEVEKRL